MKKSIIPRENPRNKQTNKQTNKLKGIILLLFIALLPFSIKAQISVASTGNVEIAGGLNVDVYGASSKTYPDYTSTGYMGLSTNRFLKMHTFSIWAGGVYLGSDARIKENFRTIDSPLEKVLRLNGKKYDLKKDDSDDTGNEKDKKLKKEMKKDRLGFVAQEVLEIIPEAVFFDEENDQYYIEYTSIIPVIVEAMKEQQTKIETLQAEIETLKSSPKEKSAFIGDEIGEPATLSQNIPNPFSTNTSIEMHLPNTISRATLYIYNMQGEQIKQLAVNERGNTSVTIEGHSLKAGMYLYTLIANGKEVDTKKMILTK